LFGEVAIYGYISVWNFTPDHKGAYNYLVKNNCQVVTRICLCPFPEFFGRLWIEIESDIVSGPRPRRHGSRRPQITPCDDGRLLNQVPTMNNIPARPPLAIFQNLHVGWDLAAKRSHCGFLRRMEGSRINDCLESELYIDFGQLVRC